MPNGEGLKAARLLMVLSSMSPLFILWAVRGTRLIRDRYTVSICAALVVLPNAFLWARIRTAKRSRDRRDLVVGSAEDHRDHVLVYLLAMLLPFYPIDVGGWRDLAALLVALLFIIFIFVYLNLHYTNPVFALRGYNVFTVFAPADENPLTSRTGNVVITRRAALEPGKHISAYRLSNTVYLEAE